MKIGVRMADMEGQTQGRLVFSISLFLLLGTFSFANAIESPHQIGYFCGPDATSIVDGQYYIPPSTTCTYQSPSISGFKAGGLYRGTVGSSTNISGHGLGQNAQANDSDRIFNPQQGEDFFVEIHRDRGPDFGDNVAFRNYLEHGIGVPPHQDYGIIGFKYGMPPPPEPETPDPVIIIPGILGSEKNSAGEWIIDPILHTYDDLITTLDANGYTPDVDLFTFPYNWRKSNVETAILLKQKIDAVKAICGCDKVDLVAHSMGGLVARQYIQSDDYVHDVDQLIFLGTPHLGAPKTYLMWEGGELSPINDFFDEFSEKFLEHEAYEKGHSSLFAYIRTESIDSILELLPTHDYIFDDLTLRSYPTNYPQNSFLEALNNNVSSLLNSSVEIHNIIGNTNIPETITAIQATDSQEYLPMWAHGYPDGFYDFLGDHGLVRGIGDKTVPLPSASFINQNLSSIASVHQTLPQEAEGDVYQILTGEVATTLVNNWDIPNAKIILFQIFSPADLLVVDPNGNKIGKESGQEINQIPGAFYSGFNTDTEYIAILNPLDGEYKIITQGTGSGAYTVETTYISEATTTEASYTGNTTPGLVTELKLEVDNENPQEIQITPSDTIPPTIVITSPVAKDYLRSEQMPVNVAATDSESGVQSLETRLDGNVIPNVGSVDLFYGSLGSHILFASSTDVAGNATTSSRTFRVVADATSTLSDIDRTYSLGWSTKKVHDDLIKKLKACNVKRTTITNITKVVVVTGSNGKPTTKKIQEKVTKVEIVFDKNCAKTMLKVLDKYRNKGLNEQGYQLLREDILWLVNN